DLAYNFLMSQQDVRINASPSITTLNQTPAQISIVEEISINNGAAPIDNNANITFEKSFSRQEYGTTIVITPTIHEPEIGDPNQQRYVTLETNVEFDTITSDVNDRPKVNKRHLENQVRVMDEETVILGGIRRKSSEDVSEKIPFLGELPGIGKFFGTSKMTDQLTEMFIFITPRIIANPEEDLIRIRNEALKKRPGDLPEFLEQIEAAKKRHKKKIFANSFRLLFGNVDD
ncbi:MAG: type II secretion system protein GspD, partial [Simkaniaceae bacterium]|nr:type II secretion system protein GspD [Simkaniaceae bacterium]